ncbi:ammonium transporter [Humisphaera borealis]|uniref:Ammonium transporter n=1 Tax=Humisphaera borealis TaxID=2807512 RepID=A0A7M2WTJ9_9BACT|nr:ammonium transporter [Humisphaera borealis]QOV88759.1 ammonium transporter [Humisphaera borealis]
MYGADAGFCVRADSPRGPPTIDDAIKKSADLQQVANTVWTLICGMLVFWMNAGFATLEAGLCRRKNSVHILAKNFIVFAVSSIAFWVAGFGMMFGASVIGGKTPDGGGAAFAGFLGWAPMFPGLTGDGANYPALSWTNVPEGVKFFFQLVFAGTAATIVSGAVAERTKFNAFMIFSFVLVALIYPITGHWIWGNGWLANLSSAPFHDFAGSTVVHSVGGWAALAGVIIIGPRIGKYTAEGKANTIPGHNMGLAALGCLILWLGWFGFNPGSTMTANLMIGHIAVTTNTAAAFGAVTATIVAWVVLGKPDFGMILNGGLAGLVGITASCAVVSVASAAIIGTIAGGLVVFSVLFFDKLKLDDPVGALSVHLVCGVFGTICVGLFANPEIIPLQVTDVYVKPGLFFGGGATQLIAQLIGIGAVGATVLVASLITWVILKVTIGVRVSATEEIEGLDVGEHGMEGYPGFALDTAGEKDHTLAPGTAKGTLATA